MKSTFSATLGQSIVGDGGGSGAIGFIFLFRYANTNTLDSQYSDGATWGDANFDNFFQNLDNQWIHIVTVCDYSNKTIKAYRNGVQFGATQNLTTPVFPSTDRVKYVGARDTTRSKLTDGSLDEVRIYNRGLSAEEVMAIYNQTKGKYE